MCGIAGIVGELDAVADKAALSRMVAALARRGPDGAGVEAWPQAMLGHRRLAIFDLSTAGLQPMVNPNRSVGVVFNGAIYNFHALRRELQQCGYKFKSDTDTEVLIHGYREWGIDQLVSRLRGMFAFGLWDDEAVKLYLVRDRLGVKPLVYAMTKGKIAFASTVRALRSGGYVSEIDPQAVAEYLHYGFVTDERSIYQNARKVPAATIIEWSVGKEPKSRRYWEPPTAAARAKPGSFDEAVEETERLFLRAVEMRLHADVPVGALLSGGVDSSLVCWAIAKLGGDITAYTIGTPNDPWDETADARQTAQSLGIEHRVLEMSGSDSPDVTDLAAAFAEPFACASALGMLRVSQAVASEATVLLTGDGGDDVFLGYPEHLHLYLAERLARFLPVAAAGGWRALSPHVPKKGALRRAASFLNYAAGGIGAVAANRDGLPMYRQHNMLGERLFDVRVKQSELPWSSASARNVLSDFLEYDRETRFVGEYLPKVDGTTMYHALEARSPFLDQELWEYAAALPYEVRLKNSTLKAVLRELARRKIGARVAQGKKRGFGVPVGRWLAGPWRKTVEEHLRHSLLLDGGWIQTEPVLAQLELAAQQGSAPNQLWYLYVLEVWLRYEQNQKLNSDVQAPPVLENALT